jgi:hypothetical protein
MTTADKLPLPSQAPRIPPAEIELKESGSGSITSGSDGLVSREVVLRWLVHSMADYAKAETKAAELAPLYYDGHRRTSLTPRPVGGGWYEIEATYGNTGIEKYADAGVDGENGAVLVPFSISFDTTGGTEHVTQAYGPEDNKAPIYREYAEEGQEPPDSQGAINVSGNNVNGLDITVPTFTWTETWLVPAWYLMRGEKPKQENLATSEPAKDPKPLRPYATQLYEMTGQVNEKAWRSFAPGEVLFFGARFDASKLSTMVPVTYSFQARPNREKFAIGNVKDIEKDGWDHLWIMYGDATSESVPVKKPRYVFVDQVYPRREFIDLKLGEFWPRFYIVHGNDFTHPINPEKKGFA